MTSPGTQQDSEGARSAGDETQQNERVYAAPVMRFDLQEVLKELREQENYQQPGPTGRTLVVQPDLRIVLMALRSGGRLEEHDASGPVSIHALGGRIRVGLPSDSVELSNGQLLALEPGIRHVVEAIEESAFLLTIGQTTYH